MTQVAEILTELQRRGVAATAEGETLCLKPKDALDEDLLARLREHKPEILDVLSKRPATCGASCYEIQPGRWVHRHGCATGPRPQPAKAVPQMECKHCEGRGLCNCLACNLRRTEAAVPCLICQADQRQLWLAATRRDTCWHCAGQGTCGCFLCVDPQTPQAGFCIVCGRSDRVRLQ